MDNIILHSFQQLCFALFDRLIFLHFWECKLRQDFCQEFNMKFHWVMIVIWTNCSTKKKIKQNAKFLFTLQMVWKWMHQQLSLAMSHQWFHFHLHVLFSFQHKENFLIKKACLALSKIINTQRKKGWLKICNLFKKSLEPIQTMLRSLKIS